MNIVWATTMATARYPILSRQIMTAVFRIIRTICTTFWKIKSSYAVTIEPKIPSGNVNARLTIMISITKQRVDVEVESQSDKECNDSDDGVENKEHSKHGVLLLQLSFGPEFCRIADNGISKAKIHDGQIGNDRCDERVKSILALSHHA